MDLLGYAIAIVIIAVVIIGMYTLWEILNLESDVDDMLERTEQEEAYWGRINIARAKNGYGPARRRK